MCTDLGRQEEKPKNTNATQCEGETPCASGHASVEAKDSERDSPNGRAAHEIQHEKCGVELRPEKRRDQNGGKANQPERYSRPERNKQGNCQCEISQPFHGT
ncbi:MAG: hypothetical protein O9255_11370 [Silanimonas sp.]|nr:hypothetical protein [Silanimonas sp.]